MADSRPRLSATAAPLVSSGVSGDLRSALAWISRAGFAGMQLSATDPEMRPREMSGSARRDLAATLSRLELACSGIDFLIAAEHLLDPVHSTRAFDALCAVIDFAALLGRTPVTIPLAAREACELRAAIAARAERDGVPILLSATEREDLPALEAPFAASIDCAAVLGAGRDPVELVGAGGGRIGGVRVVDLLRSGLRGPILEPRESRLDALGLRIALETVGFNGLPVVDARQWHAPDQGLARTLARWNGLISPTNA